MWVCRVLVLAALAGLAAAEPRAQEESYPQLISGPYSEQNAERFPWSYPEQNSDRPPWSYPEQNSDRLPWSYPEQNSDRLPWSYPEQNSDRLPWSYPEQNSDRPPWSYPEQNSDRPPWSYPEQNPGRSEWSYPDRYPDSEPFPMYDFECTGHEIWRHRNQDGSCAICACVVDDYGRLSASCLNCNGYCGGPTPKPPPQPIPIPQPNDEPPVPWPPEPYPPIPEPYVPYPFPPLPFPPQPILPPQPELNPCPIIEVPVPMPIIVRGKYIYVATPRQDLTPEPPMPGLHFISQICRNYPPNVPFLGSELCTLNICRIRYNIVYVETQRMPNCVIDADPFYGAQPLYKSELGSVNEDTEGSSNIENGRTFNSDSAYGGRYPSVLPGSYSSADDSSYTESGYFSGDLGGSYSPANTLPFQGYESKNRGDYSSANAPSVLGGYGSHPRKYYPDEDNAGLASLVGLQSRRAPSADANGNANVAPEAYVGYPGGGLSSAYKPTNALSVNSGYAGYESNTADPLPPSSVGYLGAGNSASANAAAQTPWLNSGLGTSQTQPNALPLINTNEGAIAPSYLASSLENTETLKK